MAEVNVRIKAQNQTRTGFQQALGDAQNFGNRASGTLRQSFAGVASDIKSSIGGALAGLASFGAIRAIFDKFGRVQDLSEQFGVSAESLQRLGQLATESGSSIDQVAAALSRLIVNVQKAQGGTGAQADALRELGLSASELANISPEEAFFRLSDALRQADGSGGAYAAALDLIGSRQRDLLPLLAQGSEAIRAQADSMNVASDELVAKVDDIGDKFSRLWQNLQVGVGPLIAVIGQLGLTVLSVADSIRDKLATSITTSFMAIGQVLSGNFRTAGEIMRGEADATSQQWDELKKKVESIWSKPPPNPGRGVHAKIEADLEDRRDQESGDRIGTRLGNVTGKQLGPGDFDGIKELEREREAAARALGPEFGPGTADAAAGGFRVDAADFALKQREEALRIAQQQAQQTAFAGDFGASSLQRIGGASTEFFRVRGDSPADVAKEVKRNADYTKQLVEILKKGEPLVLPSS